MKILIDITEHHIAEMLNIEEKINIESYRATEVETEVLNRITNEVKNICRDIEENYY